MELYISLLSTVLIAVFIMALHCFYTKRNSGSTPLNWPVVGMIPSLLWNMSNIYDYASKVLFENGGTFKFKGPWMAKDLFEVLTCTPANLEYVLKKDFSNFPRGPYFKGVFMEIFGDGLFTADDDLWRCQRKAVGTAFTTSRDGSLMLLQKLLEEKLIPVLEQAKVKKSSLDLQDLFLRFNFDNMCITVLGRDPGSLSLNLPEVPFLKAFHEAIEACTYRLLMPRFLWKLMKFMNLGYERKLRRSARIVHDYASGMVRARIQDLKEMSKLPQGDILSNCIKMEAEEGRSASEKMLQDLTLSIFLAGIDTVALSLCWFFWLLSRNPHVEEKIVSEISMIRSSKVEDKYFGWEDLKNMNYFQASLSESMRLYPPVPLSYRQATEDNVLPDGTMVKKGSKLLYVIYATNRMESLWGKDAREFKPERWINKDGVCIKESDYKYPVFNAGSRLCLGRDIAYWNMKCMAAYILAQYKVKVDHEHPLMAKFGLTLFLKHGLKVTLHSRKDIVD